MISSDDGDWVWWNVKENEVCLLHYISSRSGFISFLYSSYIHTHTQTNIGLQQTHRNLSVGPWRLSGVNCFQSLQFFIHLSERNIKQMTERDAFSFLFPIYTYATLLQIFTANRKDDRIIKNKIYISVFHFIAENKFYFIFFSWTAFSSLLFSTVPQPQCPRVHIVHLLILIWHYNNYMLLSSNVT